MNRTMARGVLFGLAVAALMLVAAPAYAQLGTIKGRVVDESGKPVAGATVQFDYTGELNLHFTGKTDNNGEYIRAGLMAVGGKWNVTAKKGDLSGIARSVDVPLEATLTVPDIVISKGGATATPGAGNAEAEAKAKAQADLQKLFTDVNALMAAGNYDDAITKLNAETAKNDKCAQCYVALGDAYSKKSDSADAEKSYLKAVDVDPTSADAANAYDGLANVYNNEHKFDEAAKASQKAMELHGSTGGASDPTSIFNAGVIYWNQSKIPEAEAQFQKVIQLKPDRAEAHYYYGMCLVNEGKIDQAKQALNEYLKLAPNGQNAAVAKSVLDTMK
jgi:tetratricopeptide (TPR) repeat protein